MGKKIGRPSQLTAAQIEEIRHARDFQKIPWVRLAEKYDMSASYLCQLISGRAEEMRNEQKEERRVARLRAQFGISIEDYDAMLAKQNGGCAICGRTAEKEGRRLCVDHDHTFETPRGLLCKRCNAGIGFFDDDPALIEAAGRYLRAHAQQK